MCFFFRKSIAVQARRMPKVERSRGCWSFCFFDKLFWPKSLPNPTFPTAGFDFYARGRHHCSLKTRFSRLPAILNFYAFLTFPGRLNRLSGKRGQRPFPRVGIPFTYTATFPSRIHGCLVSKFLNSPVFLELIQIKQNSKTDRPWWFAYHSGLIT